MRPSGSHCEPGLTLGFAFTPNRRVLARDFLSRCAARARGSRAGGIIRGRYGIGPSSGSVK